LSILSGDRKFFLFRLTRLDISVYAASATILAGIYSRDLTDLQLDFLIGFLIILLAAMGSFSINDYYDFQVDKMNMRYDRPLVQNPSKRGLALKLGITLYLAAFSLSLLFPTIISLFILINFIVFFMYNYELKKKLFLKNILVSYGFSAPIIFGSIISDLELEPLILYFVIMSIIVGLGFEIMLDINDVEGDMRSGILTIPVKFSKKVAAKALILLYSIIMVLNPLPFFVNIDKSLYRNILFFFLIMIPVASYFFISRSLLRNQSRSNISNLRKRTIITMQIGCIVYVIGVLF
jgi:geranylgeranylglycerol-phosphate geranylgeranyltransferase